MHTGGKDDIDVSLTVPHRKTLTTARAHMGIIKFIFAAHSQYIAYVLARRRQHAALGYN